MSTVLEHRFALITGASMGLGFEIAKRYLEAGASIMICGRSEIPLHEAASKLKSLAPTGQAVHAMPADVSKEQDVRALVAATLREFGRLDILVNNAGVVGPLGAIETVDWEEWRRSIDINLFGSVLLCRAVLPHFKTQQHGKIIQLSGGGATYPLPMRSAYAASKAAVIRFAETLAEETRPHHIDVNAIAPGALNTRILDQFLLAGPEKIGAIPYDQLLKQKRDGGVPLNKGADLAVFLGSSASDGITGKLISAPWDPWGEFPIHLEDLSGTDVYTLRRILPKDRGHTWGEPD
jgi:NAD(P)-dependent dehydrogenase (short-subunit alcohol dehydrogenase family)